MKTILFATALAVGSMAAAQETTEQPATDQTAAEPAAPTAAPAPAPAAGPSVAPGNDNPERDARGIPVVSDPASAPAGANQPVSAPPGATVVPSSNQSAVFTTSQSTEDYPACSKTVTDNCVQSYERGRGPRR